LATIRKRSEYSWEAQIRRKGQPSITKTFLYRKDAETWARQTEAEIDKGSFVSATRATRTTFEDLAKDFENDFAPHHYRGTAWKHKLTHLRARLDKYSLLAITPQVVTKYRDARLSDPDPRYKDSEKAPRVSGATVKTELDLLSKMIDVGSKEFGIALPAGNPVLGVRKPKGGVPRERRLQGNEEKKVLDECDRSKNPWLGSIVRIAIESAMRQGEILALAWSRIDLKNRIAILPVLEGASKSGETRAAPLSSGAASILKSLKAKRLEGDNEDRVFPIGKPTLIHAWQAAVKRAGAKDLTFHDLRHEALSRLAERGDFNVLELAAVSGHKTLQVLKRYTHLQAAKLAAKMG